MVGSVARALARAGFLLAVLLLPIAGYAQEAALGGTVTDATGGVLPGVTIVAVHEQSGNTFEGVTDAVGAFRLSVRVGSYRITVELPGFATVSRTGVNVLVGQTVALTIQMQPSSLQETVTVTGEAALIDTTSSSLGANIDPRQMQELPVNGRNWMDLTTLAPGSRQNGVAETPTTSTGSNVNFQLNLDGQQVTNLVAVGFGQPRYSRDAIGEFEFVSNRFDASQGRSSGVQVNAVTKSGTNSPQGTFSGYFRHDALNGEDPVAKRVLPYQDQQISMTFGGPLIRDKFHFFLGYEYEREPQTYIYTTPYPSFNRELTGTRRQDMSMARLDYQFSSSTRLSIRGNRYDNRVPYDSRYTGGSDRTPASAIGLVRRSQQAYVNLTQVLGSRAVNQVRGGHNLFHWNQYSHVKNANSLPGQEQGLGAPVIIAQGLTIGQTHAITPQDIGQEFYSIRDDFNMNFAKGGRHDLKIGGEYLHDFSFETVCQTCMGQYNLTGGPLPANLESLFPDIMDVSTWNLNALSSIAVNYQRNIATDSSIWSRPAGNSGFTEYAPRHVMAFWLQDDWQISQKLTLNLGLRHDAAVGAFVNWVEFPPFAKKDRPNDMNNFGPRAGFAYSVDDKTVIRGGWGKYFGEITSQPAVFTLRFVQQIQPLIQNTPVRADFMSNPFNGPAPTYNQALALTCANAPNPLATTCLRPGLQNFVADDLVNPYSYQSSIGLQRQIGSVMAFEADWVFTQTRDEFNARNINIAFDPATGAPYRITGAGTNFALRPFPAWGVTQVNRPDADSNFNALQTSFTKRMANRWQASVTYSFSTQNNFDQLPLNPGCQNPVTVASATSGARCDVPVTVPEDISQNDWYLTGDQRHRANFNGIWDIGYGMQLSGLYVYGDNGKATGQAGVDARGLNVTTGRLRANGTIIDRNTVDLQSIHRVDMRFQKRFALGPRVKIDGLFEVFNLLNRANYDPALYTLNERNARFGQPNQSTQVTYSPRMLQLGFRAQF